MPETSRRTELLMAAADALDSGDDPFGGTFLSDNEVTSDECMSLVGQLALGARIVARGLDSPRSAEGIAVFTTLAAQVFDA